MLELSHSTVEAPVELVRRLTQLQLCRPADFRRARACVRRLSRDLPTFDSVWFDALVQLRKLTPFQARMLEAGRADELRIDGCVVLEELGHGPHGTTLLAKVAGRHDRVVLKRLASAVELIPECRQRLVQFIERSHGWSHPNLVVPHKLLSEAELLLVTVSRWIPGLTLRELLVRRGRFPPAIVLEIARQLASGLAALHKQGLVHGDIRLSNVRLTTVGSVVLVDGGVRPAVCPELTIHETLALDAYDGVAPELIGTGNGADAASEIYGLGCLLWQLLTGRPPHSMADPLMKLAAHQTQRIADVRSLAPDTPAALAESIVAMTSPDANERPRSFDDLLHRSGRPGLSSRSRLKRYRKNFDGAVPHFIQNGGRRVTDNRWPWIAVSLFVAVGMALTFADQGLRNEMLSITRRVADAFQSRQPTETETNPPASSQPGGAATTDAGGLLPLPAQSDDGEIVLAEAGPYDVSRVTAQGNLTIRGVPGVNPVIQIGREPLFLEGATIKLENLRVVCDDAEGHSLPAMLLVKSNQLVIQGCVFHRSIPEDDQSGSAESVNYRAALVAQSSIVLAWRPLESQPAAPSSWRIDIRNTVFRAQGTALWSTELPHQVAMENCLKLGNGPCFSVSPKATVHACTLDLARVTLRDSGPLVRLAGSYADRANAPTIEFLANDCVFDLATTSPGLIELQTIQPRTDAARAIHMRGRGSVVAPNVHLMVTVDPAIQEPSRQFAREVADADEQFEGIVVSELLFKGRATGPTGNSHLENLSPRSAADTLPGVETSRLPAIKSGH